MILVNFRSPPVYTSNSEVSCHTGSEGKGRGWDGTLETSFPPVYEKENDLKFLLSFSTNFIKDTKTLRNTNCLSVSLRSLYYFLYLESLYSHLTYRNFSYRKMSETFVSLHEHFGTHDKTHNRSFVYVYIEHHITNKQKGKVYRIIVSGFMNIKGIEGVV